MSNGSDSKYRSRKFMIAGSNLFVATIMGVWGCLLSDEAQDVAMIIGAWGVVTAAVLKLYSDANITEKNGGK